MKFTLILKTKKREKNSSENIYICMQSKIALNSAIFLLYIPSVCKKIIKNNLLVLENILMYN